MLVPKLIHVLGDLLKRGGDPPTSHALLRIAYAHLLAYKSCRARAQETADHRVSEPR